MEEENEITSHTNLNPLISLSLTNSEPFESIENKTSSEFSFSLEDFEIKKILGKGSYGKVFECIRKSDNQTFALKEINFLKFPKLEQKIRERTENEIEVLATVKHEYIIEMKGILKTQDKLFILMKLYDDSLQNFLERRNLNLQEIYKFCFHILSGLKFLHSMQIAHRDIKVISFLFSRISN